MGSNSIEYGLKFSQEEYEEIEDLAAIGYSVAKIALYFDLVEKDVQREFNKENSLVRRHYQIGLTKADAAIGLTLVANAKIGNITAIQQLEKVRKKTKVELIKQQIYFHNELE